MVIPWVKALSRTVYCTQHCSCLNTRGAECLGGDDGQHYKSSFFFGMVTFCSSFLTGDWCLCGALCSLVLCHNMGYT